MTIKHISHGTLIGPMHIAKDIPNQDYADYVIKKDYTILALADGAGSLERSDEGAQLAVNQALTLIEGLLLEDKDRKLEDILASGFYSAEQIIKLNGLATDGGCTLVLAIITSEEFIVGAVGDSFSVIETNDGELKLLQPPPAGEFVNITKLITSDDYILSTIKGNRGRLRSISLCSDAFELATLKNREPAAGFWKNIFSKAHSGNFEVDSLLAFMQEQEKLDDDATSIIAAFTADETNEEFLEFSLEKKDVINIVENY